MAFPELEIMQFHGGETATELAARRRCLNHRDIWKAVGVAKAEDVVEAPRPFIGAVDLILFDQAKIPVGATVMGGSGHAFRWDWLDRFGAAVPFGVAGGVTPSNALGLKGLKVTPAVVDTASGVERGMPGIKDRGLIEALVRILGTSALAMSLFAWGWRGFSPAGGAAFGESVALAADAASSDDGDVIDGDDHRHDDSEDAIGLSPGAAGRKKSSIIPNIPVPQSIPSSSEVHRWDRYVRGFRREHNFAFSLGIAKGTWDVRHFGTLEQKKYSNSGVFTRFQYSFHLPLVGGFGYLLGSSFGYLYESTDKRREFQAVPALMFPGLLAGFVENFSPVFRWSAALDIYLERLNGLAEHDGTQPDPEIYVTMEAFDFGTFFDIFYDLEWAVRLELHHRHSEYLEPLCAVGEDCRHDFPSNANIKKDDDWVGLGLVLHLL